MINTKNLLGQLLQSGSGLLKQQTGHASAGQPAKSQDLMSTVTGLLKGKGGAAAAGGALGLLLGSKSGRSVGGKVLTYGGIAALGALAYQALKNHQQKSASTQYAPFNALPEPAQQQHCKVVLCALIAAAKADGHIDARERELIDSEISKFSADTSVQQWLHSELQKPLDPTEIAALAADESMAAEIYLASLLAIDEENYMEKVYLQELAKHLRLAPALQTELRAQVQQAIAATQS